MDNSQNETNFQVEPLQILLVAIVSYICRIFLIGTHAKFELQIIL